jgi:hypothetical protein
MGELFENEDGVKPVLVLSATSKTDVGTLSGGRLAGSVAEEFSP